MHIFIYFTLLYLLYGRTAAAVSVDGMEWTGMVWNEGSEYCKCRESIVMSEWVDGWMHACMHEWVCMILPTERDGLGVTSAA